MLLHAPSARAPTASMESSLTASSPCSPPRPAAARGTRQRAATTMRTLRATRSPSDRTDPGSRHQWSGRKHSRRRSVDGAATSAVIGRRAGPSLPVPSRRCSNGPRCPSGPRVISARLPGARSVSIAAYVLAGSRLETPAEAGVAHFMEHITFKGTAALPVDAGDLARRSRASAARSTPRPTASRPSTGSASRAARRPGRWTSSAS